MNTQIHITDIAQTVQDMASFVPGFKEVYVRDGVGMGATNFRYFNIAVHFIDGTEISKSLVKPEHLEAAVSALQNELSKRQLYLLTA